MDATRLLGDGIPVALADGETVTVRFDFEAMLRLEAQYGSTFEFVTALDARLKGKGYGAVLAGLRAAVRDRDVKPDDLDPRDFAVYRQAIVDAWFRAMPEVSDKAGEGKDDGETGTGLASTTSPRSLSDARKKSGAA